ncbi:MAG: hypothetical protein K2M55_05940 [Muribaculaceae bacterium]|nr:hypothetical protein [Muribaculaceae bacterium]
MNAHVTPGRLLRLALLIIAVAIPCVANTAASIQNGQLQTSSYTYTGGITGGKQNGYGVSRYKNGDIYYGYWNMGYKQGLGRLVHSNGAMEFGIWHRGTIAKNTHHRFTVGQKVYGIDVSRHNKTIDWEKLYLRANANGDVASTSKNNPYYQPVLFAIAKSTEGVTILDPTFERNFREAKRCGIIRGAYHFLSVNSPVEKQVEYFIKNTPLEKGDLPPVLDLEINKNTMKKQHAKVCSMAKKWLQLVEKHYGVKPIIYTYNNYYIDYMKGHGFDDYDFWIARYGAEPSARHWEIWQYTDKGHANGVNHAVDIDLFRGDYKALRKYVAEKGIK